MSNKIFFTSIAVLGITVQSFAQVHRCGTVELSQARDHEYPGFLEAVDRTFEQAKLAAERSAASPPVYQIPVVVHIIHNTPEENLPWDVIDSQIARLNTDYRRLNADTTDTRSEFLPVAADVEIEFYLTGEDPNGDPHGGITRTQTNRVDFAIDIFGNGMDEMKQTSTGGVAAWDTDRFLNIWVCDLVGDNALFPILGYAYPPASAPNWPANSEAPSSDFEGAVIHYEVFGDGNPLSAGQWSIADQGRTAVHEVGHYLGLRHIWGDAFFDGCSADDGLDDTPNAAASAGQTCNFGSNSCTDTPVDHPDMIENYMDYAEESCMNMFTQDQADIMRAMLEGPRSGLLNDQPAPSSISQHMLGKLSVYPNPSNGVVTIASETGSQPVQFQVVDVFGRVVSAKRLSGSSKTTVDLSGLEIGQYLIRMANQNGTISQGRVVLVD